MGTVMETLKNIIAYLFLVVLAAAIIFMCIEDRVFLLVVLCVLFVAWGFWSVCRLFCR